MSTPLSTTGSTKAGTGPFTYKIITCGKLTRAERNAGDTNAKYGVVVRARNVSNSFTGEPQYTVEFLRGSTVDGENYPGGDQSSPLSPGQSQDLEADIVPSAGSGHPGDTCKITQEAVFRQGTATAIATYYP